MGLTGISWVPAEAYFSYPALNCSTLKAFADLGDQMIEETPSMAFGSLAHCAILEPSELENRYYVTDVDRRGTKAWAAAEEAAAGRTLVKAADMDAAWLMAQSVHEHSEAMELLRGARFEASCFWTDDETGLACKCRPDVIGRYLVDLKTTESAKAEKFARKMFDFRYDWSDAWYCEGLASRGLAHDRMLFLAIESKPKLLAGSVAKRHPIGIFQVSDDDRATARDAIREARRVYAYCQRNNDWPGYPAHIQTAVKPRYLKGGV